MTDIKAQRAALDVGVCVRVCGGRVRVRVCVLILPFLSVFPFLPLRTRPMSF